MFCPFRSWPYSLGKLAVVLPAGRYRLGALSTVSLIVYNNFNIIATIYGQLFLRLFSKAFF